MSARISFARLAIPAIAMLAAFPAQDAAAGGEPSHIKVGKLAATTTPATADSFYGSATTSTREFWGPDPTANRPVELKELARALRNDVDLIYEYVHDNIETVFMYGVQKGAFGAMIDQSGTPFDQAQLMVELLRESGYSTRYKAGTISFSTAQAQAWMGTNDTTAITQIFRDGGMPVTFSGGVFTLSHIWVEVTIPGSPCNTTCWFDPSYKQHTFKSPLNLETLMGWAGDEFGTGASSFLTQSWSGSTTSSTPPVWIRDVHDGNLQTKLQSYASTLLTNLRSSYKDKEIEDIVGGQEINRTGPAPVRNNGTFTGFTPIAVQRTWDCGGPSTCGIPDQYRTRLTVSMLAQTNPDTSPPLITKEFFVDEIYGRRLSFDTPSALSLPGELNFTESFWPFCVKLTLDGVPVPDKSTNCIATTPEPPSRDHQLRIEVDHPYAAAHPMAIPGAQAGCTTPPAGSYMDRTICMGSHIQKLADFVLPVAIVHGWGNVSPALVSKLASEQRTDRLIPRHNPNGTPEPEEFPRDGSATDHTMTKLGASYLAQYSRMAELQKRIGNAEHVMHHMVGSIYAEANAATDWPPGANFMLKWLIRDRSIRTNVDGAISVTSKANVAADRSKVLQSTLAAAATLEASVYEQMLDSPNAASTATRFQWGDANFGTTMKFFLYTPATAGSIGTGFTASGCPAGVGGSGATAAAEYVNASHNYWAIVASERCLGPGNKHGAVGPSGHEATMQRGGAFMTWRQDETAVAHIVNYYASDQFKGGGAGVAATYQNEADPTGAASLLKDKFEDKSRLHGIDLQTGDFSYSPPPDLRIGEGGFPYELTLQRSFKSGESHSPGLPKGWAYNLDVRAAISGDGLAAMGRDSHYQAAATIAALYTAQKLYSVAPAHCTMPCTPTGTQQLDHLKRWVLAPFVMNWWGTKLTYNVVTINAGHDARQFTRLVDGTFSPPRNGVGTLAQTGARSLHAIPSFPAENFDRWDYSAITFAYTSSEKDVQNFTYHTSSLSQGAGGITNEENLGTRHGWHLGTWVFPYGVTITYNYVQNDGTARNVDRLTSVTNNLGRTISFTYAGPLDEVKLSSITDGQSRTVQYSNSGALFSVTSPENEVSKYEHIGAGMNTALYPAGARPQVFPRLLRVFAPTDATFPKVEVTYDRTWRVKEYRDAVAIKTPAQRGPYEYFITGTSRGTRRDPLGSDYTAYYDSRGRAITFEDEEGRDYVQLFDNHDRVKERTFPEGNKVKLEYHDPTHQISKLTQVRKSSTYWAPATADIVVQATYDPDCGKIKTVTDAISQVTTWLYNTTTCTLTSVTQPQVANPQAGGAMASPVTQYLYNAQGQLTQITDPTARLVSFEYDATTKYRLRRRADPSGLNLITTYGHNAYGDINAVTDPRGNITNYTFDKQRRLKQVNAPLNATTINRIDADGDVYQVERAKNAAQTQWQVWQKTFTPTKQTATETSPTSAVTSYTYDKLDRVDVVTDPLGRKVKTEYFKDGKTKKIIKAFESPSVPAINYATYTLTPNGQIDTVADANNNLTNLDYDGFDRPHRTFFAHATSGTVCTPAIPHTTAAPSCAGGQMYEELGYDVKGNVTTKRNRSGGAITFIFDNLNREITRNVPANSLSHFLRSLANTYDLASRKWDATVTESPLTTQTISHRYDSVGRVDFVDDSYLGATNRVDYGYDPAGNRTSLTWPGGGSLTYTFDALNRMDTVTEAGTGVLLADYDWDVLSRRDLSKFNANGFNADYAYEDDDDLSSLAHTGPKPVTFTFGRNAASQLTSLTSSDASFLSQPATAVTDTYTANKLNQIGTLNAVSYGHDANGNLTSDGTYTFEYDEENRLRSAVGGGFTTTYEYDPLGRRRAKIVNGTPTRFVSDAAEEIEERDGSNNVLRKYAYGSSIDDRIAMKDAAACTGANTWCFYLTNWQGSTTTLVNQSGTLKDVYHYGPYGEGVGWTPADAFTGNPFRYTGRRIDPETGLYYYRARYYSTKVGRFLQVDPVGTKDDLNLYAYVANDPLGNTDPSGKERFREEFEMSVQERGGNYPGVGTTPEAQEASATLRTVIGTGLVAIVAAPVLAMAAPAAPVAAETASAAVTAARGAAALARAEGATAGATSGAVAATGEIATGASTAAGGSGVATNAAVQTALDAVPAAMRSAYHGCCAEIAALSNLAHAGAKLEGAVVATVRAAGSGADKIMRACSTCAAVAEKLGVRVVQP